MLLKLTRSSVRFPLRVETRPFLKLYWKIELAGLWLLLELARKVGNEHAPSCLSWQGSLLGAGWDRILFPDFPSSWMWRWRVGSQKSIPYPQPAFPNPGGGDVEILCAGSQPWELLIRFPWCCLILNHPSWHTSHCYCLHEVRSG